MVNGKIKKKKKLKMYLHTEYVLRIAHAYTSVKMTQL